MTGQQKGRSAAATRRRGPGPPVLGIDGASAPRYSGKPAWAQLQRSWGNRRVTALLSRLSLQRDGADDQATMFDAKSARNELIRAIDTTPIQLPFSPDHPQYIPRKINVDKVVAVLENRTPAQITEIRQSYQDHQGHSLDHDLFSTDKGGTNLSIPDHARITALLRGTTADSVTTTAAMATSVLSVVVSEDEAKAMGAALAQAASENAEKQASDARAEATAAELRKLLTDDPNERERERIMALLRNDAPGPKAAATNGTIAGHYQRFFSDNLITDLRKYLKGADVERAEKLVGGDRVGADAVAVRQRLAKIAEINQKIDAQEAALRAQEKLDPTGMLGATASLVSGSVTAVMPEVVKEKLEKQRREQIAAMEAVLERARQEARSLAEPGAALNAGAERVRQILAQPAPGGKTLGDVAAGTLPLDARGVLAALQATEPQGGADPHYPAPELVAARIYQAVGTPTLTAAYVESELRGLRVQAEADARADALAKLAELIKDQPIADRAAAAEAVEMAMPKLRNTRQATYFTQLKKSYNSKFGESGPAAGERFDNLIAHLDSDEDTGKLAALLAGQGTFGAGLDGELKELQFALEGSHHDIETVKRLFSGKNGVQVKTLEDAFNAASPKKPLKEVLFGRAPTDTETALGVLSVAGGGIGAGLGSPMIHWIPGKASGHDAFVLKELLDVPKELGGAEEAKYLATQTGKEAAWAISDSGWTGGVYDWTGNETRDLMEGTVSETFSDFRLYHSLLAAGKKEEAEKVLVQLRKDRARMRVDRAAYSDSIDQFRSQLATALSIAVDIAVMVFLPAAAPFLVGVAVTAGGHIAANLIVYGDKYSPEMLKSDLLGAIGAAGGAKLAGLAFAGRAAGAGVRATEAIAERAAGAGTRAAEELAEQAAIAASKTIAREASGYASESILAMAKRQVGRLGVEVVENAAGIAGAEVATTGEIHAPSIKEIALGIAQGRGGHWLKGGGHGARTPHEVPTRPVEEPAGAGGHPTPTGPEHLPRPEHPSPTPDHPTGTPEHPTPEHPTPEHPAPGEHPTPADDAHTRPTKPYETVPEPHGADEPTRKSDDTVTNVPDPLRGFEVEKTKVDRIKTGRAMQVADPHDPIESFKLYKQARALDPLREVGLMYNRKLDQWAVVQGGPSETAFGAAGRELGWSMADVKIERHVHPPKEATGATAPHDLLASGRGGDVSGIAKDAARGGPESATSFEIIDVMVDRGPGQPPEADRTFLVYDRKANLWTIDYPKPGANRGRGRVSFSKIEMYHKWYRRQFGKSPGKSLPREAGQRRSAMQEEIAEGFRASAEHAEGTFTAAVEDALSKVPEASAKIDQAKSALKSDDHEAADLLDQLKMRVEQIPVEARTNTDPASGAAQLAQAQRLLAEVDATLKRLPALAAVRAQRRGYAKDPKLASSVAELDLIDARLRRGELTNQEGRQALERVRERTRVSPGSAPIVSPDTGVVLSGDVGPPQGWQIDKMSYAECRRLLEAGQAVLRPEVVLEFPHGYAWLDTNGEVVAHGKLGKSLGKRHRQQLGTQKAYAQANPKQKTAFASEIMHLLGPGTGYEAQVGAAHGPKAVNQRLQNWGIESALRRIWADANGAPSKRAKAWRAELVAKGLTVPDINVTARMGYSTDLPGYIDHVSYTVSVPGSNGPTVLFQVGIHVEYASAGSGAAPGPNHGRIVLTVEPLAPAGEYQWVRDEMESSRFRTRILDERRKLDMPGWKVSGGEEY